MTNTNINSFNMKRLGQTISSNRKRINLTQNELAEKLYVTYQAVSSWENGLTAPEISKLIDLANIFEISIDELMGNSEIAESINKYDQAEVLDVIDLNRMTPLLKPKEFNSALDAIDEKDINHREAISLAPFAEETFFDRWFKEHGPKLKFDILIDFFPFLSQEQLNEIVEKYLKDQDINSRLAAIFPFLDQANLERILKIADDNVIIILAPFLSEESLSNFIDQRLASNKFDGLVSIAPFLSKADLAKIVGRLTADGHLNQVKSFLPFI